MRRRHAQIVLAIFSVAVICIALWFAWDRGERPFLTYAVDEFKTGFESGNLTASITHDWPRVAFYHSNDMFSPTFLIDMPAIYLFNDTDGNGLFTMSEATHVAYLDDLHNVTWDISDVQMGADPSIGRFALLSRSAEIALYACCEPLEPVLEEWAIANFTFRITEGPILQHNDLGSYQVAGMTDIDVRMTLEILRQVNSTGLVVEQSLKGGLTTNTFVLTEDIGLNQLNMTEVSSRVDETVNGDDLAHRFNLTGLPTQDIDIAKDEGPVQAHYRMDSVPSLTEGSLVRSIRMNCSYFTTGYGMVLHTAFMVPDANGTISYEAFLGIDESGFYEGVSDWFEENLVAIMVVVGVVAVMALTALFLMIPKRKRKDVKDEPDRPPEGPPPSGG